MSHFVIGILVPETHALSQTNVEIWLHDILEPFSEHLEVAPYQKQCWCVGRKAENYGHQMANRLVGTWDERQGLFDAYLKTEKPDLAELRLNEWQNPEVGNEWQAFNADFNREWEEIADAYAQYHALYLKPSPDCESCNGTGKYETTYNPRSKWDWWRIGGRWDGSLFGMEDEVATDKGFNWGDEHTTIDRNMRPVKDLLVNGRKDMYLPFALVTPDGQWHEKAAMGWWGVTRDDKDPLEWGDMVQTAYERYADHQFVIVDAHI